MQTLNPQNHLEEYRRTSYLFNMTHAPWSKTVLDTSFLVRETNSGKPMRNLTVSTAVHSSQLYTGFHRSSSKVHCKQQQGTLAKPTTLSSSAIPTSVWGHQPTSIKFIQHHQDIWIAALVLLEGILQKNVQIH